MDQKTENRRPELLFTLLTTIPLICLLLSLTTLCVSYRVYRLVFRPTGVSRVSLLPTLAPAPTDTPPPPATDTPRVSTPVQITVSPLWLSPTVVPTLSPPAAPSTTPTTKLTATPRHTSTPSPTHTAQAPTSTPTTIPISKAGPMPAPSRQLSPFPTPAPLPTPTPGQPALSGKIAFPIYDPEKKVYDLYVADIDGLHRRLIAERASQPAFSPDGQHLAFRSWRADALGLMVADAEGLTSQRITTYVEDAMPAWSKDVPLLAFASQREPDRRWRIYGVAVSGEYEWPFQHGSSAIFGRFPTWLPQSRVVYAGCVNNECGIRFMYGDGSGLKALTSDPKDTAPGAAPDGNIIAFMSDREGDWEIYTVGVDGEGPTRLTDDAATDGLPTWSPDGQAIAFVSNRGGEWAIWAMRSDGSEQRKLFDLGGGFGSGDQDWTLERISWGP